MPGSLCMIFIIIVLLSDAYCSTCGLLIGTMISYLSSLLFLKCNMLQIHLICLFLFSQRLQINEQVFGPVTFQ